jgi:hypothetical protein
MAKAKDAIDTAATDTDSIIASLKPIEAAPAATETPAPVVEAPAQVPFFAPVGQAPVGIAPASVPVGGVAIAEVTGVVRLSSGLTITTK